MGLRFRLGSRPTLVALAVLVWCAPLTSCADRVVIPAPAPGDPIDPELTAWLWRTCTVEILGVLPGLQGALDQSRPFLSTSRDAVRSHLEFLDGDLSLLERSADEFFWEATVGIDEDDSLTSIVCACTSGEFAVDEAADCVVATGVLIIDR